MTMRVSDLVAPVVSVFMHVSVCVFVHVCTCVCVCVSMPRLACGGHCLSDTHCFVPVLKKAP